MLDSIDDQRIFPDNVTHWRQAQIPFDMSAHAPAGAIMTRTTRRQFVAVENEFDIVYNAFIGANVAASELHINHLLKKLPSAEEGFFVYLLSLR